MDMIINMYNENHTLKEIGMIMGKSRYLIKKHLIKNNIRIRTSGETTSLKNQFMITPYINDVIIGELLGDGSIYKSGNTSGGFSYSTSKKKYLEWLYYGVFMKEGIQTMKEGIIEKIIIPSEKSIIKTPYISYKARTLSYLQFGQYRKIWYPRDTKIVPNNIIITPTVLLHWYLGDGSLQTYKGDNKRGKYIYMYKRVILHTNGFSYKECKMLSKKLNNIGLHFEVKKHHNKNKTINWQLVLIEPSKNNKMFFDFMDECPDPIKEVYGYKWDWETKKYPK